MKNLEDNKPTIIIKKTIVPVEAEGDGAIKQVESTPGFFRSIWYKIQGYNFDDVKYLKDAAVRGGIAKLLSEEAKMNKINAEAAEIFGKAEKLKIENAKERLQLKELNRKDELAEFEYNVEKAEKIAEAFDRLDSAISNIKQKGGAVGFDNEQIELFLNKFLNRSIPDSSETKKFDLK
jgi:hypothetical protein